MAEIGMVSDMATKNLVKFEEDVLMLICGYALQSVRFLEERQSFYDELIMSGIC